MANISFNEIIILLYLYFLPFILILIYALVVNVFIKKKSLKEFFSNYLSDKLILFITCFSILVAIFNFIYTQWFINTITILFFYFVISSLILISKFISKLYKQKKIKTTYKVYKECEYINLILKKHIKLTKNEAIYINKDYFEKLRNYPDYIIKFFLDSLYNQSNNSYSVFMSILFLIMGAIFSSPLNSFLTNFNAETILLKTIAPLIILVFLGTMIYNFIYLIIIEFAMNETEEIKKINLLTMYLDSKIINKD